MGAAGAGLIFGPRFLGSGDGAELLGAGFPDLEGRPRQLAEWQGKLLVCNFWATWCVPCREEMPLLADFRQRYVAKGAEVVGIGIDQAAKMRQFAKEFSIAYPLLVADANALDLMRKLGNSAGALPYTVVLGPQGEVAHRRLGLLKPGELESVAAGILR